MALPKYQRIVQQGLFDRLIDLEPTVRSEAPMSRAESLRLFRLSVKRDLEWLLNSSRAPLELPEAYSELQKSLLTYGLPDISNVAIQNSGDEKKLLRSLEQAIELFEPRLARARVTSRTAPSKRRQSITFHVEAILMIDPAPERIAFDTVLEISRGAYSVTEG
jgi:type VI secretion system protein ImpF